MKIYLDESGNLGGLGANASKDDPYFLLAALIVTEHLPIERCIKNVRRRKIKKKYKKASELKFSNSNENIRRRVLECIGGTNNDIAYSLLRKCQVTEGLQDKPQIVYNYLCKQLLYRIIGKYKVHTTPFVEIVVDKSLYGVQRENFNDYVGGRIGEGISVDIEVTHVDSRQCPCVQAVDFVAGAISRKYRNEDDSYYLKIKQRVIIELDFFEPKNRKV
jgi:hypothetical protein